MTHRQFLTWQAWLRGEWNKPGRTDHYLMQIAAEVRRGRVKNPRSVRTDDLKIPFEFKAQVSLEAHQEAVVALAKQVWIARVGGNVEERSE